MGGAELEFVREAFASNYIAPLGPMMDAFEAEFSRYVGIPYCVALSSGTAATHLALCHLLRSGGYGLSSRSIPPPLVLASTLTFIGSVTPATFEGCDLRFVDCDRESWNLDPALLAEELEKCEREGRKVLAVIPTDLYGQCSNLPRIQSLCARYACPVICDSAEAMGARYTGEQLVVTGQKAEWRHAGFDAWASIYSFNGNKIITTSGGGMLASHDPALIEHARKLSQQAREPAPWYEHTEIGFNYRMSNIVAAIGRGQLQILDERVRRKREIFAGYQRLLADLPGIAFMPEPVWSCANRWLTVILIDPAVFGTDTHAVRATLERENIESRPVWKPMHLQPVFKGCHIRGGAMSEELFAKGLCLPSGTAMTDIDIERVSGIIRDLRR
jgi:dTDP-4-amino-4,6-dideoxygalactose transaminase